MKILAPILAMTLVSTQALAATYSLISNTPSDRNSADLCSEELVISSSADKSTLTIEGANDLAVQFNHRAKEDDSTLVIKNINGSTLKDSHKVFATGERITSKTKATLKGNTLIVLSETKFGTILTSKAEGRLEMNFKATGLDIKIERSYNEPFTSSSDWAHSQVCEYKLVK